MTNNHIQLADLPYSKPVKEFLSKRYGKRQKNSMMSILLKYRIMAERRMVMRWLFTEDC